MASIALSPSSVVAGTAGNVIGITGTSTAFTGTPFTATANGGYVQGTWYTAQSVSSGTIGSITVNPGSPTYGNVTITDTISGASAQLTVTTPSLGALGLGFIGDSITEGNGGTPPTTALNTLLTGYGYTVTISNQGIAGTSTADWLQGGSNLVSAVAAIIAAGCTIVHIMLGTNDGRSPNFISATTSIANLTAIANYCVSQGLKVVLSKPPFTIPNANGGQWSNDPNTPYNQIWFGISKLANGTTVFMGDTGFFECTAAVPGNYISSDQVHPFSTGFTLMGQMWGWAILERFGFPLQGGRIIGGGVGLNSPLRMPRGLVIPAVLAGMLASDRKLLRRNLLGGWSRG